MIPYLDPEWSPAVVHEWCLAVEREFGSLPNYLKLQVMRNESGLDHDHEGATMIMWSILQAHYRGKGVHALPTHGTCVIEPDGGMHIDAIFVGEAHEAVHVSLN